MNFRTLWLAFAAVVALSFAVLGWTGLRIYQSAPPIADRVVTSDGRELIASGQIQRRPEHLAIDGRHGGGIGVGPRQLRGAGLDC